MLQHRLITGPLLLALILAVVWLDDWLDGVALEGFLSDLFRGKEHPPKGLALFALSLVVAPFAAAEMSAIFRANGIAEKRWLTTLAAVAGLVMSYSVPIDTSTSAGTPTETAIAIISTGMIVVFVLALFTFSRHHNVEGVVAAAGAVMFALVYLGLMLGFLLALRRFHSAWLVVGVIATTKACDTGAYFTGRLIGRHRMIAWLSPGKTWEGLAGGIAFAAVVGLLLAAASRRWLGEVDHVPLWLGVACGVVFAVVGQLGDLAMSLLKRGAGMKDSSSMLPGLGGVLDVLDSPLLVAPVAYWMLVTTLPSSI